MKDGEMVGLHIGIHTWNYLSKDFDLMGGFEKGLGHAWPCKGGKDGAKVLVMPRLRKGPSAASWRTKRLHFLYLLRLPLG